MTSNLDRLARLFDDISGMNPTERGRFLAELDGKEPQLAEELQALIQADSSTDEIIDRVPELHGPMQLGVDGLGLDLPNQELAPPTVLSGALGSFRILRPLGAGSMAQVYEAEQMAPRRNVALKVLRFDHASSAARRFTAEAETLARLDHPHIARVYGAGVHEPDAGSGRAALSWLAMELVPDPQPITDYCDRVQLDQHERVTMFLSVCDAVHHAHRRGVLHRDLKPANVVVSGDRPGAGPGADQGADQRADGETGRAGSVKVIDFGISRVHSVGGAELERTRSGELIGTVLYMSPEQATGNHEAIDVRSDGYALGVLLFELVLGRHPLLRGDEPMLTALAKIRGAAPLDLRGLSPQLPRDLGAILERALQPDPELRYDGVAALRDDLARFLRSEPVIARRPGPIHRMRLFARRRRGLCLALAAAAAVSIAGLTAILMLSRDAADKSANLLVAQEQLEEVRLRLADAGFKAASGVLESSTAKLATADDVLERRAIVAEAFAELERLRETLLDDQTSQGTLIDAYLAVGSMHGTEWFAPREEAQGGYQAFLRALELARRGAALNPGEESETQLLRVLSQYVDACRKVGDLKNGNMAADECVTVARSRFAARPNDPDVVSSLVGAFWARSDLQVGRGRQAQGVADSREALKIAQYGVQRFADQTRWRRLEGWSNFRLGTWLSYDPPTREEGLEHLRLAGDAALLAYSNAPDRRMRQELRTQMMLEINFRRELDPTGAQRRAAVGMKAIEQQGLDDVFALSSWTRFASACVLLAPDDPQGELAADIERRWAAVSPRDLERVAGSAADLVLQIAQVELADRPGFQPLIEHVLQQAATSATTSDAAQALYDQLREALPTQTLPQKD